MDDYDDDDNDDVIYDDNDVDDDADNDDDDDDDDNDNDDDNYDADDDDGHECVQAVLTITSWTGQGGEAALTHFKERVLQVTRQPLIPSCTGHIVPSSFSP